jgi:hypothetical protein
VYASWATCQSRCQDGGKDLDVSDDERGELESRYGSQGNPWQEGGEADESALHYDSQHRGGNRIGYLIWHFTVDQSLAIQHMPTSEQGEHADFGGPGNLYSIGIEMCEESGSDRRATIERTAKLTAVLMKKHGISLRNVVPHYHWPRRGKNPPNKNCPHFLLDGGKPGRKWKWFLGRVNDYYQRLE